jgi:hypothetical protein
MKQAHVRMFTIIQSFIQMIRSMSVFSVCTCITWAWRLASMCTARALSCKLAPRHWDRPHIYQLMTHSSSACRSCWTTSERIRAVVKNHVTVWTTVELFFCRLTLRFNIFCFLRVLLWHEPRFLRHFRYADYIAGGSKRQHRERWHISYKVAINFQSKARKNLAEIKNSVNEWKVLFYCSEKLCSRSRNE